MRKLLFFIALLPLLASGEVILELNDGPRIVTSVNKEDLARNTSEWKDTDSNPTSGDAESIVSRNTVLLSDTASTVWSVGPQRALKFPSDAAKKARDGDTIEIDAGSYQNDYAKWSQNNLTIRGKGGMAHLKSKGLIPNGKAIWIIRGNNTLIENIEYSGASVLSNNGAGIRHEGGNLTLRNTFFHDNEFSILTGKRPGAHVNVQDSRFWYQKRRSRYSHGIYIGEVARFTLIGSHFKGTDQGHQIKSRALENHVLYNRIEDVPEGNSSRLIDLSNCGLTFIIGNDMHQAATTENPDVIGYGPEGCSGRMANQMRLFVINNTFVNEARNSTLVNNHAGGDVVVANNLVFGRTVVLSGGGEARNNIRLELRERIDETWDAPAGSAAVDSALDLPETEQYPLIPRRVFNPPLGTTPRPAIGALDVGSRERISQ